MVLARKDENLPRKSLAIDVAPCLFHEGPS
jgi:hypothetical protein